MTNISLSGWLMIAALLVAIWLLSVTAWRRYLLAYVGHDPGWCVAMRQLGLLLVGKYLPGGVFGFVARVYDQPDAPRLKLLWAGLAEQAVGVGMSGLMGGIVLMAALHQRLAWLCLVLLLPLIALAGVWLLHQLASRMPWLSRFATSGVLPRWRVLSSALVLHVLQHVAWGALIMLVVTELYGLGGYSALGVAGAFLLAVVAGMLVVFAPGGIGVREAVLVGLASYWLDMSQAVLLAALLRLIASFLDSASGGVAVMIGMRRGA